LENELIEKIAVFPIPFDRKTSIIVHALKDQEVTLELYAVLGKLVYSKEVKAKKGKNTFEVTPSLLRGVYVLQIDIDGEIITHKVIKN
jgi:hypothetical protein